MRCFSVVVVPLLKQNSLNQNFFEFHTTPEVTKWPIPILSVGKTEFERNVQGTKLHETKGDVLHVPTGVSVR